MRFDYGTDLLEQLRPGLDGLIVEDGLHRALCSPRCGGSYPTAVNSSAS
jgi:hypothetical protein